MRTKKPLKEFNFKRVKIEVRAKNKCDIVAAIAYAKSQIEQGFTSGNLQSEGVDWGYWDINDE